MRLTCILLVLILILLIPLTIHARTVWYDGLIITSENQYMGGKISLDEFRDVVMIKINDRIRAFSPIQISLIKFYDPKLKLERYFYPVEYNPHPFQTKISFFELLMSGPVTIYRRIKNCFNDGDKLPDSLRKKLANLNITNEAYITAKRYNYFYLIGPDMYNEREFVKIIRDQLLPYIKIYCEGKCKIEPINPYLISDQIIISKQYNHLLKNSRPPIERDIEIISKSL
jgi:hypothetical protein